MKKFNKQNLVNILHHIGVINHSLTGLAERYEKMGFSLTPISTPKIALDPNTPPACLGISNRHAIFQNNYLELLGITDVGLWEKVPKNMLGPYNINVPLSRYEGLHVMHLGTNDIELVKDRLTEEKIPCSDIRQFQRNIRTSEGEKTMRARSIHFSSEFTPEGLVQIAQHDTPELVFQPQYMTHKNGALELTEIILCCENIEESATRYTQLSGHQAIRINRNCYMIDLGLSRIRIGTYKDIQNLIPDFNPSHLPYMAAFKVKTSNLDLTRAVLNSNIIPFIDQHSSIIVRCRDAGGCAVIFN